MRYHARYDTINTSKTRRTAQKITQTDQSLSSYLQAVPAE